MGYGTSSVARCFSWPSGTYKGGERGQIILSKFVPRTGKAIVYIYWVTWGWFDDPVLTSGDNLYPNKGE